MSKFSATFFTKNLIVGIMTGSTFDKTGEKFTIVTSAFICLN